MKCDVCQTKILLGKNTCPNCGYKIRESHASAYDASGKTHNHIQVNTDYIHSRVRKNRNIKNNRIQKILVIIIILSIMIPLGTTVTLIVGDIFHQEEQLYRIDEEIYQQNIDDGYDDGTSEKALNFEKNLIQFLSRNHYSNIVVNEEINEDNDFYKAKTIIECEKYGFYYTIEAIHQHGNIKSMQLSVYGYIDNKMKRDEFYIEENQINEIGDYIQLDNAYSVLKNSRYQMQKHGQNEYYYNQNVDSYHIDMSEEDLDDNYHFNYIITKNY